MSDQGGYAAGWYPNPDGGPGLRWYDGTRWTDDYHYDQPPQPASPTGYPAQQAQPYPAAPYGAPGGYQQGYTPYPAAAYGAPPPKSPYGYFTYVLTQNYANFEGRARRAEFWWFTLFAWIQLAVVFILAGVASDSINNPAPLGFVVLFWLFGLLLPSLAVTVRRLHDTNKSGWWLLIQLLPLGGIVILIFLLIEGDRGPNQYGWPVK